jgi:xanthine permease XanP
VGPVGSAYLLPAVASSIYLGPALMAVDMGGLPLLAGMLLFAGANEVLLPRLRPFRSRPRLPAW